MNSVLAISPAPLRSPFITSFVVGFFSQEYLMFPSNKINGQKTCLSNTHTHKIEMFTKRENSAAYH